ncbi:DUF695 domain-containing protein [Paenibacillus nanensis]|uniref:DUF695 domain-containing protein n=1 Tax=Paenibacillus nanensis TaxID=393251 RepID=A0A3A1UPH9_9BACL|nr:DUF695 domain-containing protein [Paenibacillus nanensis]RIX50264.1 DUF695 domain-containing protein [Paenibacillus nanensis]
MSDNWNTYMTYIDHKPASFLLDLDPWGSGEYDHFIHLYQLRLVLNEPTDEGLTTNEEASDLYAIEDAIHDVLSGHYLFVGRITTDGRRDFFYYTDSDDGSELKRLAAKHIVSHKYSVDRVEEQSPRSFYEQFLYPDQLSWKRMLNRQLVDKLTELGDDLRKPRPVNHWIYFSSEESCRLFMKKVQKEGFQIEEQNRQQDRYSLRISRKDEVQLHAINEVTDFLVHAAQECNGDYDGWETQVIEQKSILGGLKKMFR